MLHYVMNWKLKAHALALLSRVPSGRRAYHALQSWLGTNGLQADEYLRRALEIVDLLAELGEAPLVVGVVGVERPVEGLREAGEVELAAAVVGELPDVDVELHGTPSFGQSAAFAQGESLAHA